MTHRAQRTARLAEVTLPDFGMPTRRAGAGAGPLRRPARARCVPAMADRGYDRLVVYADREHSANLSYLTGFDPRFEEAILIVGPDGDPAILVGNECYGMAGAAPLPMRRHRFQDLSLPSQPRDRSRPLREILGDEGIGTGSRVGVIGWKTYADRRAMEVPAFLVDDAARARRSQRHRSRTPADLLIDAADGLRVDQRGRPAGGLRGGGLPDLERRPPPARRPAARAHRARGGRACSAGTARRCRAT